MQSVCYAKTRSQSAKPGVMALMKTIECKKKPKAVWKVRKLHEQQGIKSTMKQISTEARISVLEAQLPKEKKGEICSYLPGTRWQMQGENIMGSVDKHTVSCTSVQRVHLSAQKGLTLVDTIIELDSHADTCVIGDQWLVVHDHNRPVSVYGYDPNHG